MKTALRLFFVILSLSLLSIIAVGQVTTITKRTSRTLSNSNVSSFAEDSNGYIWIGTYHGLNRFNGYDYRQYFASSSDSTSINFDIIISLFVDSHKRLWVSTARGVNLYTDKDNFINIPTPYFVPNVSNFYEDYKGEIYATSFTGIVKYNASTEAFLTIVDKVPFSNITAFDNLGRAWFFYQGLAVCYDNNGIKVTELPLDTGVHIYQAITDRRGVIIVSTDRGVYKINTESNVVERFSDIFSSHPLLSKSIVTSIHLYQNNYLISTIDNGYFMYNSYNNQIIHQSDISFPLRVPDIQATAFFSDSNKNVWIGTQDKGYFVNYYSQATFNRGNVFHTFFQQMKVVGSCISEDVDVLMATKKNGIYRFSTISKQISDITTHFVGDAPAYLEKILVAKDGKVWLSSDRMLYCLRRRGNDLFEERRFMVPFPISVISEDDMQTIWVGTKSDSAFYVEKNSPNIEKIQVCFPKGYNFINDIFQLSSGEIAFAAFRKNITIVNPIDKSIVREIEILSKVKDEIFIPNQLLEDSSHKLWIATSSLGIFRYSFDTDSLEFFDVSHGLPSNSIASIIEDGKGDIWVGTLSGLSKFDRTTAKFNSWFVEDGIESNEFANRSVCLTPNKLLIFGNSMGITYFNPLDISNKVISTIEFEDFEIRSGKRRLSKEAIPYADKYILHHPKIVLAHNENNISILYSAINYSDYEQIRYSYKMDGLDKEWINAGFNRQAYYSELSSGEYVFRVRAYNPDSPNAFSENSINITIRHPFWLTYWAIILYIIVGATLFLIFFYYYRKRVRFSEELSQVKREKEQEKRMGENNMEFFTSISHEFRTPLTMISGPINQLQNKPEMDDDSKYLLSMVQRSVNRMLVLIDQILDFRKLESGVIKLNVEKTDIVAELDRIIEMFSFNFRNKNISLVKRGFVDHFDTFVDPDRLNKIMSNLLSNCLKFTPEGGEVCVDLEIIDKNQCQNIFPKEKVKDLASQYVCIRVSDTGIGFAQETLDQMFTRYFLHNRANQFSNWSSGIGMYYSYKLVTYHHGFIKAENRPMGIFVNNDDVLKGKRYSGGAVTTFAFPTSELFYPDEEKAVSSTKADLLIKDRLQEIVKQDVMEIPQSDDSRPTMMVIDDDGEVCHYLRFIISKKYNVASYLSAESALADIDNVFPNIIVSDVLMPGMNGFDFCRKIKENNSYSHIPIILLTAKAAVDNQIEGLQIGADAYVTKPFDPAYLMALIGSLLTNREKLQTFFKEHTTTEDVEPLSISAIDKHFMDSLYKIMESELSNPEINITQISQEMHLSRTKLYYKIKGLTGENPNVFFRCYKLNRAAELLCNGNYNISEVSDMTGFKTISHFSTVFKKHFGVAPTKWRK